MTEMNRVGSGTGALINTEHAVIKKEQVSLELRSKCLNANDDDDDDDDDDDEGKSPVSSGVESVASDLAVGSLGASNAVTSQTLEPTNSSVADENKLDMTSMICTGSSKQTALLDGTPALLDGTPALLDGTPALLDGTPAMTLRPTSSMRRHLPVPLSSSRSSPPKALLPQKISDSASKNGGVSVQVEMERQVKVEMVKQVKVNCAVQENCESPSPGPASRPGDSKAPNKTSSRQLSSPSKVGVAAAKLLIAQSVAAMARPETDRSGAVSAPTVGVQYTVRKGIPRQLPNADLVKRANMKESADGKILRRSSPGTEDSQRSHRSATAFDNRFPDNGKSTAGGKYPLKASNVGSRPAPGFFAAAVSKVAKVTVSLDSSPSSSASSSAVTHALVKHPLRYGQPPLASTPRLERKSLVRSSFKKADGDSDSLFAEAKAKILNIGGRKPEKPVKMVGKSPTKMSTIGQGLRKLENFMNILPKKRPGLLSVVGKDSTSSSRRTSNSSISCPSRSESTARTGSLIQNVQPNESLETEIVKHGDGEEMVGKQCAHQPDVVSNSVQREVPIKKVQQLETRCRELGKRLRCSMTELKSRTTAFIATTVAMKHFSEQVVFLSKTKSDLRSQLISNSSKCDILAVQRNALISEIQGLKEDHEVEVNGMTVTHQMELHALQERIKALVIDVEERHLHLMESAQSESRQTIEELKSEHSDEIEARNSKFSQQVADLELKHKQKVTDLQRSQENRLKEFKTQFETIKCALVEKIDHLATECSDLRHQNQVLANGNPTALNSFANNEAEKQVETLTQEIESLRVVLELRNQEIGKLRAQNVIQETQLQELGEAKQKIHQLKLKLENTEAIIHLKSDYEKELAEKHTTLLRRYSKESKVNKRLSMNNEELMWKLEQVALAPSMSPKPIRRTHSGPPAKSAPGTPLAVRRSQPEMNWESFSSDTGVLPGTEDSDLDSVIFE